MITKERRLCPFDVPADALVSAAAQSWRRIRTGARQNGEICHVNLAQTR